VQSPWCLADAGDAAEPSATRRLLVVEPEELRPDLTSPRSLIRVTVLDEDGHRLPWVPVDFETGDAQQIVFPHPRAWTNAAGVAANVAVRVPSDPQTVRTTFTVRSGEVCAGPFAVRGWRLIADGVHGFNAPPLGPFTSVRQLLVGDIGVFFEPLPPGRRLDAWSIDPTVAEPISATVGPATSQVSQRLALEVQALRRGETLFVLGTVDLALYQAVVSGSVACLAGGCAAGAPDTLALCDASGGCLEVVVPTTPAPNGPCVRRRAFQRRRECRRLCGTAIAECTVTTGQRRRVCRRQTMRRCAREGLAACLGSTTVTTTSTTPVPTEIRAWCANDLTDLGADTGAESTRFHAARVHCRV